MPPSIQPSTSLLLPTPFSYCPICGIALKHKKYQGYIRQYCEKCQRCWYHNTPRTASGIVLDRHSHILLIQKTSHHDQGRWMLPSGFCAYGEHPFVTIERELAEKTNLHATAHTFFAIEMTSNRPFLATQAHFIIMSAPTGKAQPASGISEVAYFPLTDLPPLAMPLHQTIINSYLQELEYPQAKLR